MQTARTIEFQTRCSYPETQAGSAHARKCTKQKIHVSPPLIVCSSTLLVPSVILPWHIFGFCQTMSPRHLEDHGTIRVRVLYCALGAGRERGFWMEPRVQNTLIWLPCPPACLVFHSLKACATGGRRSSIVDRDVPQSKPRDRHSRSDRPGCELHKPGQHPRGLLPPPSLSVLLLLLLLLLEW